jgi:hypothetical protein
MDLRLRSLRARQLPLVRSIAIAISQAQKKSRHRVLELPTLERGWCGSMWARIRLRINHGHLLFRRSRGKDAVFYLGFATDLDRVAFTGAPGEESFAIRSDVGTHTNEEGRSSASIEFLNR